MTDQISRAIDMLFPQDGSVVTRNIKFLRAGGSGLSAQKIAEQYVQAETAVRDGEARLVDDVDGYLTEAKQEINTAASRFDNEGLAANAFYEFHRTLQLC